MPKRPSDAFERVDKSCPETKVNRRVPDFRCNLGMGHTSPHRDPVTGIRWRHPKYPYGVRDSK